MRLRYALLAAALVLLPTVPGLAQTTDPAAAQRAIITEMRGLMDKLEATLPPAPPDEPPPPAYTTVHDAAEMTAALAKCPAGEIRAVPGVYEVNLTVSCDGTILRGADIPLRRVLQGETSAFTLKPANLQKATLAINASNVTITGFSIYSGDPRYATVTAGSDTATTAAAQPTNITVDRVEVIATNGVGKRGVQAHTRALTLIRSRVMNFLYQGEQSQAFFACNGPGPYAVVDNELVGSGENVLIGGASIRSAEMVPTNTLIKGNWIWKPQAWRTKSASVANLLELKASKGAVIEDNILDGNWKDIQAGHAIVFTPRNQDNASPWVIVDDVTFRHNVLLNNTDGYAINIMGHDDTPGRISQQMRRATIDGNLFQHAKNGIQVNRGVIERLTITNNTFPVITGNFLYFIALNADGTPMGGFTPLTLEKNVFASGAYGVNSTNKGQGTPTLAWWSNGDYAATGNVIEKSKDRPNIPWPAGNTLVAYGTLAGLLDADFRYTTEPIAGWPGPTPPTGTGDQ